MKRTFFTLMLLGLGLGAAAQELQTLREYLEAGLERNYDIRIIRNEERISDNNATAANAGKLPTIDLSAGYTGRLDNDRTTPRGGDPVTENGIYNQTFDVGLAVNWTLFDGFRIRAEYAKLEELKAKGALQTRLTIEDFIASFTAEYYNFVQQKLRLGNYLYAMALSRERLRIAEEWYRVGSSARLDVLQARVDFNADSSQYMSQQEAVTASRIRLNELLANEELDRKLHVRDSLIAIDADLEWERLMAQTRETNASLLLADRDNTISELELESIRSRNYPYLKLHPGIQPQRAVRSVCPAAVAVVRVAVSGIENARLTRMQLEQSLMADLATFWQAYRNNLEVIRLEEENLTAARENYRIAMERYRQGELPGIEMREAQKSLLDAEERILTAQYNTKLCEISLQQISGNVTVYLQ